jgi:Flp pilus assembly protein TadG
MNKSIQRLGDEKGSMSVLVAFLLLIFIAFLGLAVDFAYAYLQRARLQSVADAAALACVISPSSNPCPTSGANIYPQVNPYGFTVTTLNPGDASLCIIPAKQSACARATAQISWNTFFINLFGVSTLNLSATAVAAKTGQVPSCVMTTQNFSANGTNTIALNNCAASIGGTLSTTNKSGITINGLGSTTVFNGNSTKQCGACNPVPVGVAGQIPSLPSPVIPATNLNGSSLATLPYTSCTNSSCVPAIYTGGIVTLKSTTTLASGYYVFNNGFSNGGNTLNSGVGGVGIYVPGNMPLQLSGTVNLTAPSPTGCSAGSGVVISHPYSSSYNSLTLSGSGNSLNLTGIVNLAADDITVNGTPIAISVTGSLVAHSLTLHGNMNPQASSNPCFNLYESTGKPVLVD